MNFIADQQTLDDLNLTGKYRPDSVFNLFNRCRSRGGEALLESMFRHPLTDATQINRRVELLQYFRWKHILFPFTGELLARTREYLDMGSRRNKISVRKGLLRLRLLEAVVKDERYRVIVAGVQAMREMLRTLEGLVVLLDEDGPFGEQVLELRELLGLPGIREVMTAAGRVSAYHYILQHTCREPLERTMNIISELDLYIAVSDVARDKGFCQGVALPAGGQPSLNGDPDRVGILHIIGLYHPGLSATTAVANDLAFDAAHNTLFLTGANMSGKSTLMKAVGIAVYLAHMGFPLPVASMEFSVMDGLYSSINVPDNLALGYSHFYAEVIRVKTVAADVGRGLRLVVIFDELFKGTNVQDAYEATTAVTGAFTGWDQCFFIVSTHIIEAGEALREEHAGIQFARLPTVMKNGQPRYTHRLEEGITDDRHGMTIIRNEGILEMLE